MGKKGVKTFSFEVPEKVWNEWKNTVPRSISLKDALINLIKREVGKK
jgi:hypothetical protein